MTPEPTRKQIYFVLPDLGGGGAQKVMLSIAGGLDQTRFAPRVLVMGGSQAFSREVPPHVPIEQGGARRMRDGLPWLLRRLRADPPDVAVSVMGYLNLALLSMRPLLSRRTKFVVREANALAATLGALPRGVPGRQLYRMLYPRAAAIVCPTRTIARELETLSPRIAARAHVLANPVDVEVLRTRADLPKRHPGDGIRIVSAGRLTHQKGYDRLVALISELPDNAHVTVFGEGPARQTLEAEACRLGVASRLTFAGFTHELPAWIAGADFFVLPSRWEGLPNVVLESLALGTPARVSDQAAVDDLATEAREGAVVVRPVGPGFFSGIDGIDPGTGGTLRASLLPPAFTRGHVVDAWSNLLDQLTAAPAA